jgi:flavodoxin
MPLVVFYSRTGTTKKVGEALADLLQCDSEELIDTRNAQDP